MNVQMKRKKMKRCDKKSGKNRIFHKVADQQQRPRQHQLAPFFIEMLIVHEMWIEKLYAIAKRSDNRTTLFTHFCIVIIIIVDFHLETCKNKVALETIIGSNVIQTILSIRQMFNAQIARQCKTISNWINYAANFIENHWDLEWKVRNFRELIGLKKSFEFSWMIFGICINFIIETDAWFW